MSISQAAMFATDHASVPGALLAAVAHVQSLVTSSSAANCPEAVGVFTSAAMAARGVGGARIPEATADVRCQCGVQWPRVLEAAADACLAMCATNLAAAELLATNNAAMRVLVPGVTHPDEDAAVAVRRVLTLVSEQPGGAALSGTEAPFYVTEALLHKPQSECGKQAALLLALALLKCPELGVPLAGDAEKLVPEIAALLCGTSRVLRSLAAQLLVALCRVAPSVRVVARDKLLHVWLAGLVLGGDAGDNDILAACFTLAEQDTQVKAALVGMGCLPVLVRAGLRRVAVLHLLLELCDGEQGHCEQLGAVSGLSMELVSVLDSMPGEPPAAAACQLVKVTAATGHGADMLHALLTVACQPGTTHQYLAAAAAAAVARHVDEAELRDATRHLARFLEAFQQAAARGSHAALPMCAFLLELANAGGGFTAALASSAHVSDALDAMLHASAEQPQAVRECATALKACIWLA